MELDSLSYRFSVVLQAANGSSMTEERKNITKIMVEGRSATLYRGNGNRAILTSLNERM